MKTMAYFFLVLGLALFASVVRAETWPNTLKEYDCLEVEKFTVDREDYSTKEMERAAAIPAERLVILQHKVTGEISREKIISNVSKSDATTCTGKALVFGGKVVDYKAGSRVGRAYGSILGIGKQKFSVQCFIKDKASGNVLANKEIVDRKMGGFVGGSDEKGESDFAEKVAVFIKKGK